jgi:alpha 1,6-mannosyltransferase
MLILPLSRYLRVKFGLRWTDLKDLQEPLRIGEVLILPVTGFSPGVGLFGAKSPFGECCSQTLSAA